MIKNYQKKKQCIIGGLYRWKTNVYFIVLYPMNVYAFYYNDCYFVISSTEI